MNSKNSLKYIDFTNQVVYVGYNVSAPVKVQQAHIHNKFEIFVCQTDNMTYLINNRIYSINIGDIVILSNKDLHKVNSVKGDIFSRIVITFSKEFVKFPSLLDIFNIDNNEHIISLRDENYTNFLTIVRKLSQSIKRTDTKKDEATNIYLCELLLFLHDKKVSSNTQFQSTIYLNTFGKKLSKVQNYIEKNIDKKITLDDIATMLFVDKSYLCRLFKLQLGITVNDYIIFCKLSESLRMLRQGMSIKETAHNTGFDDERYFSTVFKRELGVSPRTYIKLEDNASFN